MNSRKILLILLINVAFLTFIGAITVKDVSSSPEEITPGEVATVSVEIKNIFEESVENLDIKLDLGGVPFAPYQSSSEGFLDELDDNDKETFTFKLIALPEAASGIYKIPVKITYDYGDEIDEEKEELISLTVNSKPELKVSLEDSVVLIKGTENEITLKVVNSGLSDSRFVYVETSDISGIKFLTNKEQYIGDIDSDDFDSVRYRIHLNADASSQISIPIIIKYKGATNKDYIETETIILKTYSLSEAQKLGIIETQNYSLYFIIGIPVTAYVLYRILKKRRLKKKDN